MSQPIIVEGDPTSTGGRMIPTQTSRKSNGKSVIRLGDKYFCPACKGMGSVVQASSLQLINSVGVAYHGCKVQCGCSGNQIVMATQSTDLVDTGGGRAATNNTNSSGTTYQTSSFDWVAFKFSDGGSYQGMGCTVLLDDKSELQGTFDNESIAKFSGLNGRTVQSIKLHTDISQKDNPSSLLDALIQKVNGA